ncbi:MAG: ATP-binding cassette domain-containing protein [Pseudomonadota bacterium]|nr:ATP-binding cassette domain-containing protein [Pseudomonadota bacterium]
MTLNTLEIKDLVIRYTRSGGLFSKRQVASAVDNVSLSIAPGRTLGLVGESGSGKSSIARAVVGLERPASGSITVEGKSLAGATASELRAYRRSVQMIFQDPYGSLDPRLRIGQSIAEPLGLDPVGSPRDRVVEALETVGLSAEAATKYPNEFSGGQRQRIAIARALITRPALVVADEPVSALDVSIQAQILNLMKELQQTHGLAYLFISHDLSVVEHLCDDVAVIHHGKIVEEGTASEVLRTPAHDYTARLKNAVPVMGRRVRGMQQTQTAPQAVPKNEDRN